VGLDVYVGSLTRYYTREWETMNAKAARELGIEYQLVGAEPADDAITDPDEVRELVDAWRTALASGTGRALEWDESVDTPYFTDKPDWDGYGALQLLAAYTELGETKPPKRDPREWGDDKRWKKVTKEQRRGNDVRFSHLYIPELWLPVRLDRPVPYVDPAGHEVLVGSTPVLLDQLDDLDAATYALTRDEHARWRREVEDPYEEDPARLGLTILLELAVQSVDHRLPMKLDY